MQTVSEYIAECEKDPKFKAVLDEARARLRAMREEMGEDAYKEYIVSHFVRVEREEK